MGAGWLQTCQRTNDMLSCDIYLVPDPECSFLKEPWSALVEVLSLYAYLRMWKQEKAYVHFAFAVNCLLGV
jgi:hypothetical protein